MKKNKLIEILKEHQIVQEYKESDISGKKLDMSYYVVNFNEICDKNNKEIHTIIEQIKYKYDYSVLNYNGSYDLFKYYLNKDLLNNLFDIIVDIEHKDTLVIDKNISGDIVGNYKRVVFYEEQY